jgi:hypothetical protein
VDQTEPDPDTSSIEELDGEPSGDRRRFQRREVLLGLGVLLGVAVLVVWYWRLDENQIAAYRAGEQAAAAHQWDEAHAWFLAAGQYPNAKTRAAEAATQIAERDKHYKAALTALANHDGIAALQAVDAVDEIEPGYGGAAMLHAEATTQIYRSALEGVVARRSAARPPGLYVRTAADWSWLQGSDLISTIHNTGNGTDIIYDVPGTGDPTARRLMAAHFDGGSLTFAPVALDARSSVFWGAQGGWSYTYGCSGSVPPQFRSYYCSDGLVYNAAGSAITTPVTLPDPRWVVVDLAPTGNQMLLAVRDAIPTGPRTSLYLAGPDGGSVRLLYEAAGEIERAVFSLDSRYVVAVLKALSKNQPTSYQLLILDTTGQAAPHIVDAGTATPDLPFSLDFVLLTGAGAGQVALVLDGGEQTILEIVSLSSAARDIQTRWIKSQFQGPLLITRLADGGVLVCGQVRRVSTLLDGVDSRSGECVQTDSAAHETTFDLPLMARYGIGYAWPRQGGLIYPIAPPGTGASGISVLRIAPAQAGAATPPPFVILELPLGTGQPLNLVAGPGLLAYARLGQLHVLTYDGTVDLLLEDGIDTLFDVRGKANNIMFF